MNRLKRSVGRKSTEFTHLRDKEDHMLLDDGLFYVICIVKSPSVAIVAQAVRLLFLCSFPPPPYRELVFSPRCLGLLYSLPIENLYYLRCTSQSKPTDPREAELYDEGRQP